MLIVSVNVHHLSVMDQIATIVKKIAEIDHVNDAKHHGFENLVTIETINNVAIQVLYELADIFQAPANLPTPAIDFTHILLSYKWGQIILISDTLTQN